MGQAREKIHVTTSAGLINKIDKELKKDLPHWQQIVLRKLSKATSDGFSDLDDLIQGFEVLTDFNDRAIEKRFALIEKNIQENSILKHEINKENTKLNQIYKQLQAQIYKFSYDCLNLRFKVPSHILLLIIHALDMFEFEKQKLRFIYHDRQKYKEIESRIDSKDGKQDDLQVIREVKELFKDYYTENHWYKFHSRNHESESRTIEKNLDTLLSGTKSSAGKIQEAIDIIIKAQDKTATEKDITLFDQKKSTFFQRTHYAVEVRLDEARLRLGSISPAS